MQPELLPPPECPARLGVYRIEALLGEGAMGSVYLGQHSLLGSRVALKMLRPEYEADPRVRFRFLREGRMLAQIEHPNLVRAYDLVEPSKGERGYLVMELLQGEPLDTRIERDGALSIDEAIHFAREVSAALNAVHARGIAHRDVKPGNIFLVEHDDGSVHAKVLDLGIAKGLGECSPHATLPETLVGTPAYMAPEQILATPIDHRVDVYALGLVLYEMLVGQSPCTGDSLPEILAWHTTQTDISVPAFVPARLADLIRRCLQLDPDHRPASMGAVDAQLAAEERERSFAGAASLGNAAPAGGPEAHGLLPTLASLETRLEAVFVTAEAEFESLPAFDAVANANEVLAAESVRALVAAPAFLAEPVARYVPAPPAEDSFEVPARMLAEPVAPNPDLHTDEIEIESPLVYQAKPRVPSHRWFAFAAVITVLACLGLIDWRTPAAAPLPPAPALMQPRMRQVEYRPVTRPEPLAPRTAPQPRAPASATIPKVQVIAANAAKTSNDCTTDLCRYGGAALNVVPRATTKSPF